MPYATEKRQAVTAILLVFMFIFAELLVAENDYQVADEDRPNFTLTQSTIIAETYISSQFNANNFLSWKRISDERSLRSNTAPDLYDRFIAQLDIFAERRLLLAAEPFAIMCAYLISTDLYRGRHVPVCREPVHLRGNSARLFYRPETI